MFAAPVPQSTPLDKDQTNTPPPSTGPYMITNVDAPNSYTLERNPQFKTLQAAGASDVPDGHADKITVTQNKNQSAQATAIEQNQNDFMVDPPPADLLPQIESQFADRFRFQDSINTYYFWMNNTTPPFNDVRVRQAVNYAIDPAALTRIFGGRLHPSQQILPPGMPGYQEYKLYPGPDLEKAKALLAQAHPSDMDITVWTDDEPDRKRIGAYYQDVLNQLGFHTTLKIIGGDVYFTTIGNLKTPDLDTGFSDWFQDYPHPNDFFQPLLAGESIHPTNNNNYGQVNIPALNKQIADARHQAADRPRCRGPVRRARQELHGAGGLGALREREVHDVHVRSDQFRRRAVQPAVQPGLLQLPADGLAAETGAVTELTGEGPQGPSLVSET